MIPAPNKRVIRRFKKDEDEKILKEIEDADGDIEVALDKLEKFFRKTHSRRAIRERYLGFLSKCTGKWTMQEDLIILEGYLTYGSKWAQISHKLNNRSGEQVKIRFKKIMNPKYRNYPTREEDLNPGPINSDEDVWAQINREFLTSITNDNRILFHNM